MPLMSFLRMALGMHIAFGFMWPFFTGSGVSSDIFVSRQVAHLISYLLGAFGRLLACPLCLGRLPPFKLLPLMSDFIGLI